MTVKTLPFDPAEVLDTREAVAAYLTDALQSGDAAEIADAFGVVARARGMSELARDTGLNRQALYRSLSSNGNPELSTLLALMESFGLSLAALPKEKVA